MINLNNSLDSHESKDTNNILSWPNIILTPEIKKVAPNLVIGWIFAEVEVEKQNNILWNELIQLWNSIKISTEEIVGLSDVEAIRQAYTKSWKEPSKYRWSAEALLRRIAQWKWLYQINNVVDINNYISLKSKIPVWSYNIENIFWDIIIRIWKNWEQYKWIWKDIINVENLPLFADEKWPFWSPTSDSERAMISLETKKILVMLISFWGNLNGNLDSYLNEWVDLLQKYANAKNISKKFII